MISFTVFGQPVAKGRPRFTKKGFAYTPAKTKNAEADLRTQVINQLPPNFTMLSNALELEVMIIRERPKSLKKMIIYPTTRPDIDNNLKLVTDALNAVVWKDDAQIVSLIAKKIFGDRPGFIINVKEL